MSTAREKMIDAAVRVYGDDVEKAAGARVWLEEMVRSSDDSELNDLGERFNALNRRAKSLPWRRIYLILSLVIVACLAISVDQLVKSERENMKWWRVMDGGAVPTVSGFPPNDLSPEAWLLLGDRSKPLLEQKKDLWDSEPENPAFFAEYAVAYYSEHKILPPDYFETSALLDPNNAWFDYYGAAAIGYRSVRKLPNNDEDQAARRAHRYEIQKRESYENALAIISRAGGKSKFDSYEHQMISRRVALLPYSNVQEFLASTAYLVGMKNESYLTLLDLAQVFCARTYELEQAKDIAGFRAFAGEGKTYILKLSQDPEFNMVSELVVRVSIAGISRHIKERAERLGIAEEFPWAAEWYAALEAQRLAKEAKREKQKEGKSVADQKGGFLALLFYSTAAEGFSDLPPPDESVFIPGRQHDYSLLSMIGSGGLRFLLAAVAVVFLLYRFRASSLVRVMARSVERLLCPVDWLWIIGGGVLLPVAVVYSLMIFTPLGSWGASVRMTVRGSNYLVQPIASFLALGVLMVIVPVLIARWRLRRKVAPLVFRGNDIVGWLAVGALLIFATAYEHGWPYWISYGCGALALLWVVVVACRAVFSRSRRLLSRVVLSRIMLPVCATGVLVAHASIFGFDAARHYWFKRDELTKLSADEPGLSKHEYRMVKQMRGDLTLLLERHR